MKFKDVFSLAYRTVRSNKLRTGITVAIIAFGIMALVGIITAIQAMNQKLTESFSSMGANGFTIRYKARNIQFGNNSSELQVEKKGARKEKKSNLGKFLKMEEAEQFLSYYDFPSEAGLSILAGRNNIVSYETRKTSPNITLFGGDENYLSLNRFEIHAGRNLSRTDLRRGPPPCLVGSGVALSPLPASPRSGAMKIICR